MPQSSLAPSFLSIGRFVWLGMALPAVLSPMALGQSSFKDAMGAGLIKFDAFLQAYAQGCP